MYLRVSKVSPGLLQSVKKSLLPSSLQLRNQVQRHFSLSKGKEESQNIDQSVQNRRLFFSDFVRNLNTMSEDEFTLFIKKIKDIYLNIFYNIFYQLKREQFNIMTRRAFNYLKSKPISKFSKEESAKVLDCILILFINRMNSFPNLDKMNDPRLSFLANLKVQHFLSPDNIQELLCLVLFFRIIKLYKISNEMSSFIRSIPDLNFTINPHLFLKFLNIHKEFPYNFETHALLKHLVKMKFDYTIGILKKIDILNHFVLNNYGFDRILFDSLTSEHDTSFKLKCKYVLSLLEIYDYLKFYVVLDLKVRASFEEILLIELPKFHYSADNMESYCSLVEIYLKLLLERRLLSSRFYEESFVFNFLKHFVDFIEYNHEDFISIQIYRIKQLMESDSIRNQYGKIDFLLKKIFDIFSNLNNYSGIQFLFPEKNNFDSLLDTNPKEELLSKSNKGKEIEENDNTIVFKFLLNYTGNAIKKGDIKIDNTTKTKISEFVFKNFLKNLDYTFCQKTKSLNTREKNPLDKTNKSLKIFDINPRLLNLFKNLLLLEEPLKTHFPLESILMLFEVLLKETHSQKAFLKTNSFLFPNILNLLVSAFHDKGGYTNEQFLNIYSNLLKFLYCHKISIDELYPSIQPLSDNALKLIKTNPKAFSNYFCPIINIQNLLFFGFYQALHPDDCLLENVLFFLEKKEFPDGIASFIENYVSGLLFKKKKICQSEATRLRLLISMRKKVNVELKFSDEFVLGLIDSNGSDF